MKTLIVTMTQINHTLRKAVSKQITGTEVNIGQQKIVDAATCDVGALVLEARMVASRVVLVMPAHRSEHRSWQSFLDGFKRARENETPANLEPTFDSSINFLLARGYHPEVIGKLITAIGLIYSEVGPDDQIEFARTGRQELCYITYNQPETVS